MDAPQRIAIVGGTAAGTATGRGLAACGHTVAVCDPDATVRGRVERDGLAALSPAQLAGAEFDVYLIAVTAPLVEGRIDTARVEEAAWWVGESIGCHTGHPVVAVRTTVLPGTTGGIVREAVETASGRRAGADFGLARNPDFLRELNEDGDFANPRVIVVGADDERSTEGLRAVYAPAWPDVPLLTMSIESAEMATYAANIFNASKISLFNELEEACTEVGADARAVFAAAVLGAEGLWNPAYGTRGHGAFGGTILPRDMLGFLEHASEIGIVDSMLMLLATVETNDRLNERRALASVAVLGEAGA